MTRLDDAREHLADLNVSAMVPLRPDIRLLRDAVQALIDHAADLDRRVPDFPAERASTLQDYDPAELARCLARRGVIVHQDDIIGVGTASGMRVDLLDGNALWVLPTWIADAKLPAQ